MKKLPILLLLLSGCAPEPRAVPDKLATVGEVRIGFGGTRAPISMGGASMSEFHYLTYDYSIGAWSGELGGVAEGSGDSSAPFWPADASRVYWPEGKSYSFYAAGYNEALAVPESAVEFGTAMTLYSSGTSAILNLKNPGHNVDWLAAKVVNQGKVAGIPLNFRHVCSRISRIIYDVSAYSEWIADRELDIADIVSLGCTLSDADEQTYIYSGNDGTLFKKESSDYTSSPEHPLDGTRALNLWAGGTSAELAFYAFPGVHRLSIHIQAVNAWGNQVVDDRVMSGDITLPMNADCELTVTLNPWDRALQLEVNTSLASWELGGSGIVEE